jgi:D-alanyl-D-alanine carboxypeptidase
MTFEPPPAAFVRRSDDPRDYAAEWAAYRLTEEGAQIATHILSCARAAIDEGVARVSTKALVEVAREWMLATINNSWTAAIADWLIAEEPRLATLIRRRARKATP